jgi:hypothetical protein
MASEKGEEKKEGMRGGRWWWKGRKDERHEHVACMSNTVS